VGLHSSEILEKHGMEPITLFLKTSKSPPLPMPPSFSGLTKISILILYTKIFSVPAFIWAARITAVIIIMCALTTSIMGLTICQPFAFNWHPTIPGGHCGNQVLSYKITGAFNLVTDLVVLLLPMPYLYGLNLALYKKLVLMVTFAVGLFTCVVSALRIAALSSIDYSDITFNVPTSLIFSGLEPSLAVTLACVPVLRPLLSKIKGSISGSGLRSGQANPCGFGSKNGPFAPLNDDSSQYQLRPVGPKHVAEAKAKTPSTWSGDNSDQETRPANKTGNIVVQREWDVAEEGR
ncbi:uncharacterized protein P884DRAFT_191750, partial [Thermothelomyces heterothallicus CBS 202.75]|uniref:uncharacterized protein n=1 Tax=Thermothelomyces heterothallicus CBS 202.75 TaxID=1149848 RepID=UPI003742C69F